MEHTAAKTGRGRTALDILSLFFIFSFLGWCLEKSFFYFAYGANVDRGFLTLPFCTIYGGPLALIRVLLGVPQDRGKYPFNLLGVLLYGALSALVATAAELLTGMFFYELFGIRLWSYIGYPHNWGGYVCLSMSVSWGALITMGMAFLWAPLEKALSRVPTAPLVFFAVVLSIALLSDFALCLAALL